MKKETETPTCEQLEILTAIADRVLMEFRVDKLGLHLKKDDPNRENQEKPMLGFVHGSPGTGKNRVINWIRRLFIEALEWNFCSLPSRTELLTPWKERPFMREEI